MRPEENTAMRRPRRVKQCIEVKRIKCKEKRSAAFEEMIGEEKPGSRKWLASSGGKCEMKSVCGQANGVSVLQYLYIKHFLNVYVCGGRMREARRLRRINECEATRETRNIIRRSNEREHGALSYRQSA